MSENPPATARFMERAGSIVLLGMVVAAPLLLLGVPKTDSTAYNLVWANQFAVLMREGEIYPRWMPFSFHGLGSPAFLFYAPLPFQLMGILNLLTFDLLGTRYLVGAYCGLALVVSGLAMRSWLRRFTTRRAATFGAMLYMAAPYHLLDIYVRGSLGEVTAYAILPLLMGAVEDLLKRQAGATVRFGLWTGLLLLSHLPSALMVGALVVPARLAYGIASGWTSWRHALPLLMRAAGAAILGLTFAAIYVLPALTLLDIASMGYLAGGFYDARHWLLVAPADWPVRHLQVFVASATAGLGVLGAALFCLGVRRSGRSDLSFWAGLALALLVLMSGIVPGIWHPQSPLSRIEFPWRLLLPAEFAAVTAAAMAGSIWTARRGLALSGSVLLSLVPAIVILVVAAGAGFAALRTTAWQRLEHASSTFYPDALEYLPQGHRVAYDAGGLSLDQFLALIAPHADQALARPVDEAARVEAVAGPRGGMLLSISAPRETRIVLRRFHYPLWRLVEEDGAAGPILEPYGSERLLSFEIPVGDRRLRLVWAPPPVVFWGAGLTLGALPVIVLMLCRPLLRRRG